MRTIEVDKNGYGYFGLINPEISTKEKLRTAVGMDGDFLDEANITYQVGDTVTIQVPFRDQPSLGHKLYYVRIYAVTDQIYKGEFIERDEV